MSTWFNYVCATRVIVREQRLRRVKIERTLFRTSDEGDVIATLGRATDFKCRKRNENRSHTIESSDAQKPAMMLEPLIRVINNQLDRYLKRPFRCFISKFICIRRCCGPLTSLLLSHIHSLCTAHRPAPAITSSCWSCGFFCMPGDYEACKLYSESSDDQAREWVINCNKLQVLMTIIDESSSWMS